MENYNLKSILGPIMIGPSSSHTAGAARLGRIAMKLAPKDFTKVSFYLHGSFRETFKGHGTDKALLAGVMDFYPDSEEIKNSFEIAKERGLEYEFIKSDLGYVHPNTVKMVFHYDDKEDFYVQGSSIGGGSILIKDINGADVEFSGEKPTLVAKYIDKKGILSRITATFAISGMNIADMHVDRTGKVATLICELDSDFDDSTIKDIGRIDDFLFVKYLNPVKEDN